MKKIILIVLVVLVLGAVAAGVFLKGRGPDVRVDREKVGRKDLTEIVSCSGTIQPKRQVDVSANTMGTILQLPIKEGKKVAAGDLLLEIDPSEYSAAVQALEATIRSAEADLALAEASLEKAQQDKERNEELAAEGMVSQEALATARTSAKVEAARVEAARHRIGQHRANLAKARHDLKQVTITAPMAGLVTRLNVEQGENVIMGTLNNPGTVLLTIADMSTLEAWVEVDETEVVKLELGQEAKIEIDAFPDQEFKGHVTEIGNSPLQTTTGATEAVDFEVKITLEENIPGIRPGLTCKAEITVAVAENVLAVPLGAVTVRDLPLTEEDITRHDGGRGEKQKAALDPLGFPPEPDENAEEEDVEREETEGVFILVDDFAHFVPVTLGIAGEDDFEVSEGLDEGQEIVAGPFRILRELKEGALVGDLDEKKKSGKSD